MAVLAQNFRPLLSCVGSWGLTLCMWKYYIERIESSICTSQ